jgi:hypothetical protein
MELVIRNRRLTEDDLTTIRGLIQAEGSRGRSHLSRRLCRLWNWRQANGAFREIACRDLLRQLERRGLIELPALKRGVRPVGHRNRVQAPLIATDPIQEPLGSIRPALRVQRVESAHQRQLLKDLLGTYHYLGFRQPTGASMGYLVYWGERPVACARFGPAAWKVTARDRFIGWEARERTSGLRHLVNNDRFLIMPWVRVDHLASHLLGRICKGLAADWQAVYRESIVLAETFVDSERFAGTCYRASNWQWLGQSQGRGRNDREHRAEHTIKHVWVYGLRRDWRRQLRGEAG